MEGCAKVPLWGIVGGMSNSTHLPPTPDAAETEHRHGYAQDTTKLLNRLRRLEGQVRGVQRMVETDQYCLDILTQLSAIIAGSRAIGLLLLDDHIRHCVMAAEGEEREAKLAELTESIERFTRTIA